MYKIKLIEKKRVFQSLTVFRIGSFLLKLLRERIFKVGDYTDLMTVMFFTINVFTSYVFYNFKHRFKKT